jgi:hypothetical protein
VTWAAHRARWRGTEYRAAPAPRPEGLWVRLRRETPAPGFTEVTPDCHVREVPVAECDVLVQVSTVCTWRGEPFAVHDEHDGRLLLEHTGGDVRRARALGAERLDRGVHRAWVPREEVRGLREEVVVLTV